MAKKSVEARQRKRERLVKQYAEKRAALKEAGEWSLLDKLPKNSSTVVHLPEEAEDLSASMAFRVLSSATWPAMAKYLVLQNHLGKHKIK